MIHNLIFINFLSLNLAEIDEKAKQIVINCCEVDFIKNNIINNSSSNYNWVKGCEIFNF
jgi:transposase